MRLRACGMLLAVGMLLVGGSAFAAPVVVFDNQFNTTWDFDFNNDGIFEETKTGSLVNMNARIRETGQTQAWAVYEDRVAPWDVGGIIFADGAIATGGIYTEIATTAGLTYTVDWGVNVSGALANPPHALTASLYDGSGVGGSVLDAHTLTSNPSPQTNSFSFVGTGGTVTLGIRLSQAGNNSSTDIVLDYVTVTAVPEPGSLMMLVCGGMAVGCVYRRRARRA